MSLEVLPLAITMIVGPGIMADVVLITAPKPVRVSAAFVAGVGLATTIGVVVALGVVSLLGNSLPFGGASSLGSLGHVIQYVVVGLLVVASVRNYVQREKIEPPRWMGVLQNAGPRRAFMTGLLLVWVMPTDLVIMLTVGVNLVHNGASLFAALPFIVATVLVAALPMLAYLLFRRRAQRLTPRVRNWMNANSWLVNIFAYAAFIVLILF